MNMKANGQLAKIEYVQARRDLLQQMLFIEQGINATIQRDLERF